MGEQAESQEESLPDSGDTHFFFNCLNVDGKWKSYKMQHCQWDFTWPLPSALTFPRDTGPKKLEAFVSTESTRTYSLLIKK